jgi:hypothetical protein
MRQGTHLVLWAAAAALLVLAGCQTVKPAAVQQSRIEAEASGFSPKAGAGHTTIDFGILFGNQDLVKSWKVTVAGATGGPVKTFVGDGKSLPSTLTWDGTTDGTTLAPEGSYTASLAVDYNGKLAAATAVSQPFVVDLTPPAAVLHVTPTQFTPTEQGEAAPVAISIDARSAMARIQGWSVSVFDAGGKLFQSFNKDWPMDSVSWDGTGLTGGLVAPDSTYSAVATVTDQYGLATTVKASIGVGATVVASAPIAPRPVPTGTDAVQATLRGFSPKSQTASRTIGFALTFDDPGHVRSWTMKVQGPGGAAVRTWTGTTAELPPLVTWDGKTDSGSFAADGSYVAELSVDYGAARPQGMTTSAPFTLDVTPPGGSIALSEQLFSPVEASDTETITVNASSPAAAIDSWTMDIYDPGGNLFRSFSARWPDTTAVWDGKGTSGQMVESAEDYVVKTSVRDEYGNVGTLAGRVPIDILVYKTPQGYRIMSSRIFFKPFTADYHDVPADIARQNMERLDALAARLEKFRDYRVKLVGHAVMIYWDDPVKGAIEQKDVLVPLSQARAEAIESAMVQRGLSADMFTVEGVGASDQIVPDSNFKDRWENRRVAFFLQK